MSCPLCETRRQLERELHDGAQQRLVVLAILLTRVSDCVPGAEAQELLVQARVELRASLAELRDVARGLLA